MLYFSNAHVQDHRSWCIVSFNQRCEVTAENLLDAPQVWLAVAGHQFWALLMHVQSTVCKGAEVKRLWVCHYSGWQRGMIEHRVCVCGLFLHVKEVFLWPPYTIVLLLVQVIVWTVWLRGTVHDVCLSALILCVKWLGVILCVPAPVEKCVDCVTYKNCISVCMCACPFNYLSHHQSLDHGHCYLGIKNRRGNLMLSLIQFCTTAHLMIRSLAWGSGTNKSSTCVKINVKVMVKASEKPFTAPKLVQKPCD